MSYGYNKYSSTMSSRGRGFSSRGGSYRGRGGGGGNEWNGSSAGGNISSRGGYSSSRGGRFKYSTTSYDSRSKYNSGSERYTSRGGRGEHSNSYKRPRDSYSGRDDHRSSSESTRKRIRSDYQGGGSGSGSQRYSSYGSSTSAPYDDNKGSSSGVYEDKRQSERASSYHRSEDRHSASRSYAPPPPPRISEMAPPPTQRYTSSRGRISHQSSNYRGRISTRGTTGRGSAFHRVSSRSDVLMARKRTLHSLDYRRKLLGSRSRDYIQRVRMTTTKLRRSGTTRLPGSKKDSGSGTSVKDKDREMAKAINAEFSDDDDEEDNKSNWDDEEKPHERDDEEDMEEEDEKKKKEDKRKKEKQDRERQHTEDEEEKDDDIKEDDDQKREEDEDDDGDDEERGEDEKAERDRTANSEDLPSRRDGRKFIKLKCPHCAHHSVTFKEYSLHLFTGRHSAAMKRIAARHKVTLTRMRVVQRQEQRRIEARDAARGTLPSRTMFCAICKLNYRSLKAAHQLSESHRQMKRFLTPFCRVCRVQFRSPMFFETHMCSLEHIKRKSILRERMNANGSGEAEADSSAPEEDDKEVNLDNFMTLDSVGDVDEDEESSEKKKEKTEGESSSEAEKKTKSKQMIKVGAEYIKRVEVQYCELCKSYLPRSENTERAIALHCSTRSHLKRYVRDNDDKALRRQAERIHLQSSSTNVNSTASTATNNTSDIAKASPTNSEPQVSVTPTTTAGDNNDVCGTEYIKMDDDKSNNLESEKNAKDNKNNQGDELDDDDYRAHGADKMIWDDVDKDLGDILRESEAGASKSSDDEDSRYDRFRNSDKKQQPGKEKENEKSEVLEDKSGNNKMKDVKN
ncbi:uncharacterized protein LOC105432700 isoform X2 [Pogonomyrmex barbatus]|uniref:Uncharacterized protein LOC105432700 isoform X2 n=1 Tax=Pogonomyrmex barbatus TaxID=144034 RepID=A0A6I9WQ89_9HYME|nr:uncharacterized protein LOC105432700 isoform X2 [Pogonomyrmex barbatus]